MTPRLLLKFMITNVQFINIILSRVKMSVIVLALLVLGTNYFIRNTPVLIAAIGCAVISSACMFVEWKFISHSIMKKSILMKISYVIFMFFTVCLFELSLSVLNEVGAAAVMVGWLVGLFSYYSWQEITISGNHI